MSAKRFFVLFLACGIGFGPNANALDMCLLKTPRPEDTAYVLAGRDWVREFAADRPQTQAVGQRQEIYRWVRSRAELGDAGAQWVVAQEIIREHGVGHCGLSDVEWGAVETWLRPSAKQGYAPARLDLARLYWNRPAGIDSPESKGLELFSRAMADDDLASQVYMGLAYACGRGVSKDLIEARKRFASAAVQVPFIAIAQTARALDWTTARARAVAVKGATRAALPEDTCDGRW